MKLRALILILGLSACLGSELHAQMRVQLEISRRLHIIYEPIVATVSITNLTGQDIILRDTEAQPWFSFQIIGDSERSVPPVNTGYHIEPLAMGAGETVKRQVNLTPLYAFSELGAYNIRASVFYAPANKYFSSPKAMIQLTEGTTMWEQVVGAPADSEDSAGGYRTITLMSHRTDRHTILYFRVVDKERGRILATHPLGRVVMGQSPSTMLDAANRLHVLQLIAPKTYLYSRITPNGELLGQNTILSPKERPALRKVASGAVAVKGGVVEELAAAPNVGAPADPAVTGRPKISERPPGMP